MDTDELPPLPAPALPAGYYRHHTSPGGNYTADQMRAYGDARAAEELERAAALVESRAGALQTGAYDALIAAAAAIRDL